MDGPRPSPEYIIPVNKRLIYALYVTNRGNEENIKKALLDLRACVVSSIDRRRLPLAVISDAQCAEFLETSNTKEKMKIFSYLPIIFKDAIEQRIPVITVHTFLNAWKKRGPSLYYQNQIIQRALPPRASLPLTPLTSRNVTLEKPGHLTRISHSHVLIRDPDSQYATMFKSIKLPVMHVGPIFGNSLFHLASPDMEAKRKKELVKEDFSYEDVSTESFREYGRPKAHKPHSGYCEVCGATHSNLGKHFKSPEHLKKTNAVGFYRELDEILAGFEEVNLNSNSPNHDDTAFIDCSPDHHFLEDSHFPGDDELNRSEIVITSDSAHWSNAPCPSDVADLPETPLKGRHRA